jgi:hypothetical protein
MPIAVAADDNVRLILKGMWNGEVETNNVFYGHVDSLSGVIDGPATLADMAQGFWEGTKGALLPFTWVGQVYTEVVAESLDADANLVNGESFLIPSGDGTGGDSADALPSFNALTFKFVRPDATKRHGFKRLAGGTEAIQIDGVLTSTGVTGMNALAAVFAGSYQFYRTISTVLTALGGQWHLNLVQRHLNGDVVSPAVFYDPATVVFDKIGHQDTRDVGRGV